VPLKRAKPETALPWGRPGTYQTKRKPTMSYSTGNPIRDAWLERAVSTLREAGEAVTLEACDALLPDAFALDAEELAGTLSNEAPTEVELGGTYVPPENEPTGEAKFDPISGATIAPPSKSLGNIEPPHENGTAHTAKATPQPITTYDEATRIIVAAQRAIGELRLIVNQRARETAECRRKLTAVIDAYVAGSGVPQTQLEASRDYVNTSQALRAARVAAGGPGTSATARAFVQKRMENGPQRGALSQAGRARYGFVVPGSPAAKAGTIVPDKIRGEQ
jgi:hypothetical protein